MNKDLTVGKPGKVLWLFCMPLFGSVIFQQLYNIADSFVVGRYVGENALAAVGNSYEITLIFIAVGFGCNIGCSVIVSRLFGTKEYARMKTAVYTSFFGTGALVAILVFLGMFLGDDMLRLIHTPEIVFADSALYLKIYVWGLPFLFFYNVCNGIFSALGDSKTPFLFLAASSLTNIGMDVYFVRELHMGVAGVAWATFLCQGVSCILAVIFVWCRLAKLQTTEKPKLFSWKLLGRIAEIAVPSMLQQSFVSVGNIILQRMINGFGPSVMAGYSAAIKLNNLVITSLTTLGNGISNFASQNLGAKKPDRIREGFSAGGRIVCIISAFFTLLYFGAGKVFVALFMGDYEGEALATGVQFLRIVSPFYFIVSLKLVADGVLRGVGAMGRFMISTFTDLILRVLLAFLFSTVLDFGSVGIWCAWPFGWFIGMVLSVVFYRGVVRNLMSSRTAGR